jgi:hypothetical protein
MRGALANFADEARVSMVPIDAIVVIQVHVAVRPEGPDLYRPSISVEGRSVLVRGLRDAGNATFGQDIEFPPIPGSCAKDRECLLNSFEPEIKTLRLVGTVAGDGFATTLAASLPPQ